MESVSFHLTFYETSEATEAVSKAADLLGMELVETGKMGKRTR